MAARAGTMTNGGRLFAVLACMALVTVAACEQNNPANADVIPVKIAGKTFYLEVAAEDKVRMRGMGGRTHIADDGGMIFVFTPSQTRVQSFLMRDCPIPMDIIYLDGAGRVLTTYTMVPEAPRKDDGSEGKEGEIDGSGTIAYDARLKKYSSRFPSPIVIEVKEGTVDRLGVKEGDRIEFDTAGLKQRAK